MTDLFALLREQGAAWLDGHGPHADIVLATRARLARNLKAFPFPHLATAAELGTVLGDLGRRLQRQPEFAAGWNLDFGELAPNQRQLLRDSLLATGALLAAPERRGLVLAPALAHAALINEEDHLRLLAYRSGFAPFDALDDVLALDKRLDDEIEPAFAEDLGYLTTSPTNVGTGLRLSVLLHLPGLVLADEIDKILNALRQLQFAVKGLFGEGRAVRGAIFQIANLTTLGRDERETAADFDVHVGKIIRYEQAARELLLDRDALGLEDLAQRSLAVLRHARLITSQEACDCLSQVRLGVGLGLLPPLDMGLLNRALVTHSPAHLEHAAGGRLGRREKMAARAGLLREYFAP